MRKIILSIFFAVILFSICTAKPTNHYKFKLKIDPQTKLLQSNLKFTFTPEQDLDTLVFYLHRNLKLESFISSVEMDYSVDSSDINYLTEANKLVLIFEKPITNKDSLRLELKYSGQIGIVEPWQNNRITEEWIELGLYAPWYLYSPEIRSFSYDGELELDPNYTLVANALTGKRESVFFFKSQGLVNDIVFAASKELKVSKNSKGAHTVGLYHFELDNLTTKQMTENLLNVLDVYSHWFGDAKFSENNVVIAPREIGGGYARPGFICLSNVSAEDFTNKKAAYLRYFSHELAHIWWNKADTRCWEDWLNESLAEYSALMVIREMIGLEEFEKRIARKIEASKNKPAIFQLDRKHDDAYTVLYDKGSVLLYHLEQKIGKSAFKELFCNLFSKKYLTTEVFLDVLQSVAGEGARVKFLESLKK